MKITILILAVFVASTQQQSGHYWRDYSGNIPTDALRVSRTPNSDGSYSYIGQGYYRNQGLVPSTITPGVQEISVNSGNTVKQSKYNKILCVIYGDDFRWEKVTASDLNVQISGRNVVVGGHYDSKDRTLYIGRIWIGGKYLIGSVDAHDVGKAYLSYIDGKKVKEASSYEILLYYGNNTRPVTG